MIEDYAYWGGDGGLTEAVMREACCLPPRDLRQLASRAATVIDIAEEERAAAPEEEWAKMHAFLIDHLLSLNRLDITKGMLLKLKFHDAPNVNKEDMIESLQANQILRPSKGGKGRAGPTSEAFILCLRADSLTADVKSKPEGHDVVYPERYRSKDFEAYVGQHPFRRENARLLGEICQKFGPKLAKGRPPQRVLQKKEDLNARGDKLLAHEDGCDRLLAELSKPEPVASLSPPRRRLKTKSPEVTVKEECEAKEDPNGFHITISRRYKYPDSLNIRSRKQVHGYGAQKLPRRSQVVLFQDTMDLDIENSVFTVLAQLLPKLNVKPQLPDTLLNVLNACAEKRAQVCRENLKMSQDRRPSFAIAVVCTWLLRGF